MHSNSTRRRSTRPWTKVTTKAAAVTSLDCAAAMHPVDYGPDEEVIIPEQAYLIVEGRNLFPLTHSMVMIGRHYENPLVLNEPPPRPDLRETAYFGKGAL